MDELTWPVSIKGVVTAAGRVLLLRNERDEWELPGGRLEPGETPEDCVAREVREETGLDVEVGTIVDAWVYPVLPERRVLVVTYRCADIGPTATGVHDTASGLPRLTLSDEHREVRWIPIGDCDAEPMPDGYRRSIRAATTVRSPAPPP